jgi:nucleotide-binding universal stress UspA family protein
MIAGFVTQQGLIKKFGQKEFQQRIAPRFPGLSTLGVIGIVFVAIALKSKTIAGSPQMLLYILIPLSLIYAFNYILSTFIGKFFLPRNDAIALVYGSVMRNLSIALAIAINAFGAEGSSAALVVAIAYIIQVQSAAWYVKFTDTFFGEKDTEKPLQSAEPVIIPEEAPVVSMVPDIKRILYATDLSENAKYAVRYACSIGYKYDAHVTVLHVVPDVLEEFSSGTGINLKKHLGEKKWKELNTSGITAATEAIKKRIEKMSAIVMQEIPTCPVSQGNVRVEVGHPAKTIVTIAEKEKYDLIIMGTHGHGQFENLMVGSIAEGVIKRSQIPVLVVRLP